MTSVGIDLEKKFMEIREAREANRKLFNTFLFTFYVKAYVKYKLIFKLLSLPFDLVLTSLDLVTRYRRCFRGLFILRMSVY